MKSKIQRTYGPIHFEDLEHRRFEDLVFNVLYRSKKWYKLNHLGRTGDDNGIDVEGLEIVSEKQVHKTIIQCKRYQSISPSEIEKVVKEICSKNPEHKTVYLVVACNVSKKSHDKLEKLKSELNIVEIFVWTKSHLEAILYNQFPDLLHIYFGVGSGTAFDERLELLVKRKQYRDSLKMEIMNPFNPSEDIIGPHRFKHLKLIIRSVMDGDEETFQDDYGWYSYFGVEPYDINDLGIIIIHYSGDGIYELKFLPYENMLLMDFENGEGRPIIYCLFNAMDGPFKKFGEYPRLYIGQ